MATVNSQYGTKGGGTSSGGGSLVTPVALSSDYTLQSSDDGGTFYCQSVLTITIPAGLSPMPQVTVIPPPSGSVTVHPDPGVLLSGVTADQAFNYSGSQTGIALMPEYGTQDSYGLAGAAYNWATLPGAPGDNGALATILAGKEALHPSINNQGGAYTLASTDHNGIVVVGASSTDKSVNVPSSLSVPGTAFRCRVIYKNMTSAVGRIKIAQSSGSVLKCGVNASGAGGSAVWILPTATNQFTGAVFLGVTAIVNIAAVDIVADGTSGEFLVIPIFGSVNSV